MNNYAQSAIEFQRVIVNDSQKEKIEKSNVITISYGCGQSQ
jgi:hypothetical protein